MGKPNRPTCAQHGRWGDWRLGTSGPGSLTTDGCTCLRNSGRVVGTWPASGWRSHARPRLPGGGVIRSPCHGRTVPELFDGAEAQRPRARLSLGRMRVRFPSVPCNTYSARPVVEWPPDRGVAQTAERPPDMRKAGGAIPPAPTGAEIICGGGGALVIARFTGSSTGRAGGC